jgi:hypothetical protein
VLECDQVKINNLDTTLNKQVEEGRTKKEENNTRAQPNTQGPTTVPTGAENLAPTWGPSRNKFVSQDPARNIKDVTTFHVSVYAAGYQYFVLSRIYIQFNMTAVEAAHYGGGKWKLDNLIYPSCKFTVVKLHIQP